MVEEDNFSYRPYFEDNRSGEFFFLKRFAGGWRRMAEKIYPVRILREAKRICKTHHVDAIHLLTVDYTCALIVPQLKKMAEVYYTVHDFITHESYLKNIRERVISSYIRLGVTCNFKQIDNLVTNSKNQYDMIKKACPGKNVYYHIFPSLVAGLIIRGNEVCPELYDAGKYILFFGNIDEYKGVKYLYDAFKSNDKLSEYKLVIAGKGTIYFPHACNEQHVVFINRHIKDSEVKQLFLQAACVVYPYISATQSGVLTLAYKFRTPALVSDIPFFRESSAGNCCLFFKRTDTADLSKQLETLLFETDISEMKAAQKEYYDRNYSDDAMISSIETVYTSNRL
jgi:glycosyltransferase involved in cell wall biosynthesis